MRCTSRARGLQNLLRSYADSGGTLRTMRTMDRPVFQRAKHARTRSVRTTIAEGCGPCLAKPKVGALGVRHYVVLHCVRC